MFILSIVIKLYFMNFNWSRTKEVNLLFTGTLKDEGLLKALDVASCWKNYLSAFDDFSCLKGQETKINIY